MERIPTYQDTSSSFEQEIILGDRLVNLTIAWNSRSESWYMTIEDNDTGDIVSDIKMVPNWLLLKQYKSYIPNIDGDIILVATDTNVSERVTYDNLNNGYELSYVTDEEAEAWEDYNGIG